MGIGVRLRVSRLSILRRLGWVILLSYVDYMWIFVSARLPVSKLCACKHIETPNPDTPNPKFSGFRV